MQYYEPCQISEDNINLIGNRKFTSSYNIKIWNR